MKHKRKHVKGLALLLSLAMIFSTVGTTVYAEEAAGAVSGNSVSEGEEGGSEPGGEETGGEEGGSEPGGEEAGGEEAGGEEGGSESGGEETGGEEGGSEPGGEESGGEEGGSESGGEESGGEEAGGEDGSESGGEDAGTGDGDSARQAESFLPLEEAVAGQEVPVGTALDALTLPEQLEAEDAEGNRFTIPVTWESEPEYDGNAAGEYIFSPALAEGYTAAEGAVLPSIIVTVQDSELSGAPGMDGPDAAVKQAESFLPLDEAVAVQEVPVGTKQEELTLPEQLEAEDAEGTVFSIPVTWESEPEYDGETVGEYIFSPVLAEGFTAAEGAELPAITVTVQEEAEVYADGTYPVTTDNFNETVEQIKASSQTEITLVLSEDIGSGIEFAGIEGKRVTLKSEGDGLRSISLAAELVGDLTVDNVRIDAGNLYCSGYKTVFTENSEFTIRGTLYGGGNKKTVERTYVKINGTGKINTADMENVVIGGSYKGSVEGDIYVELAGNISYGTDQGGHYLAATNKATAYGGDKYTGDPLYVGGDVTLILDSPVEDTRPQNVIGAYNSHVKGDVTVQVKSGYFNGIHGMREDPDQSKVDGNIHIIAGDPAYEDTDQICRLTYNWDIVGAGEQINLTGKLYQVGGNVTVDVYENVWGWDKGGTPPSDPPGIVGAESAVVAGDITINAYGSHLEDLVAVDESGTSGSVVEGDVVINAIGVDLRNPWNDQSGIIPVLDGKVSQNVTVNLDGGSLSGIYGYGGTVDGNMEINITGEPVFTDDEAGVWGVNSTASQDKSVLNLDKAKTSIPIVGYFTEMNVRDNSDVILGNEKKNAFSIYDVNINTGAKLTTNKQAYSKGALTMDQGTWTANGYVYITDGTNTQNSELILNDYAAFGYGFKDAGAYDQTVVVSRNDTYIFNKHTYTDKIYGNADIEGGTWKVFVPTVIGGNYMGTGNQVWLPAFEGSENYPNKTIPLEILGSAAGSTAVTLVDRTDTTKEGVPVVGQNYINALRISEDVFRLANENAKPEGLYFLKTSDADTADKGDYDMWQVAKKDGGGDEGTGGEGGDGHKPDPEDKPDSSGPNQPSAPVTPAQPIPVPAPSLPIPPVAPVMPIQPVTPSAPADGTPKTGDETNLAFWLILMGISFVGAASVLAVSGIQRKKTGHRKRK